MLKSRPALPDPESQLLDYAERLTHHRAGRRALFVALSTLAPPPEAGAHWRVFLDLLSPIIRRRGGEIFRLASGDAAAVLTSADLALAERISLKLRTLFRDDPSISRAEKESEDTLCRWFDLGSEYDAFLALARKIKAEAEPASVPVPAHAPAPLDRRAEEEPHPAPLLEWLSAPPVGPRALERLATAGLAARLRKGEAPQLMFELLVPRAEALADLGLPQAEIERNPRLTAALLSLATRRLLIEIPGARKPNERLAVGVGIDALLGTEFLTLHRNWALGRWSPLTLIVSHAEMIADMARFAYVRKMLRKFGHRLGIGAAPFEVLSERKRLDADLVTFAWTPAYGRGDGPEFDALKDGFAAQSPENVMLTGVDTREALAFARSLGLTLIAGRQAAVQLGGNQ